MVDALLKADQPPQTLLDLAAERILGGKGQSTADHA